MLVQSKMEYIKKFKSETDWMNRLSKSQSLRKKYPDKLPVIVDRGNTQMPKLKNNKYLVPNDFIVGQFMNVIRKNVKLEPEEAMFLFVGDGQTLPSNGGMMSQLYQESQDRDGFLYFLVSKESTFGGSDPAPATQ